MAKTILSSILHEREHYCVSVRDASAIMLERVQCGVQHSFSHVINLLLLLRYTIKQRNRDMAILENAQETNALQFRQNTLEFSITLISAFSLLTKIMTAQHV